MELVLANRSLAGLGGSETYLVTVAEHLQRLGHLVTLFAEEVGFVAESAAARGLRVASATSALPEAPDALFVQDGVCAYRLAEHFPNAPQLYVAHSALFDLQQPPQLQDVVAAIVVLNDRVGKRIAALANTPRTIRLCQPVDTERFAPTGAVRARARRVLALGNYLQGPRLEVLEQACEALKLELVRVGAPGKQAGDPRPEIAAADIVVGKGRVILEAMACGRAAYVYDQWGQGGWVTANSYAKHEAEGFAGIESGAPFSLTQLRDDLAAYDGQMGAANRDLALSRHSAREHAQELMGVLRELAPRANGASGPLSELARLVRTVWQAESVSLALRFENEVLSERVRALDERVAELVAELGQESARVASGAVELEKATARAAELDRALATSNGMLRTRRFRAAQALAWPFDTARRLARR